MATKIYGTSDDLIEFKGDVYGEVGSYDAPTLVICSDGTLLDVSYGKGEMGIWRIDVINKGSLFDNFETCTDEDADPYSDVVTFKDGLKWAYAAKEWEKVK